MIYFIILILVMTVQRVFHLALFACIHVCMCASQACSRSHARLQDLFVQAKRCHQRSPWLTFQSHRGREGRVARRVAGRKWKVPSSLDCASSIVESSALAEGQRCIVRRQRRASWS